MYLNFIKSLHNLFPRQLKIKENDIYQKVALNLFMLSLRDVRD